MGWEGVGWSCPLDVDLGSGLHFPQLMVKVRIGEGKLILNLYLHHRVGLRVKDRLWQSEPPEGEWMNPQWAASTLHEDRRLGWGEDHILVKYLAQAISPLSLSRSHVSNSRYPDKPGGREGGREDRSRGREEKEGGKKEREREFVWGGDKRNWKKERWGVEDEV